MEIHTVNDFIANFYERFPRHAEEIRAWEPDYRRALGSLTPDALRKAVFRVLDRWRHSYPPKPVEFFGERRDLGGRKAPSYGPGKKKLEAAMLRAKLLFGDWRAANAARLGALDTIEAGHAERLAAHQARLLALGIEAGKIDGRTVLIFAEYDWQDAKDRFEGQRAAYIRARGYGDVKGFRTLGQAVSALPAAAKLKPHHVANPNDPRTSEDRQAALAHWQRP